MVVNEHIFHVRRAWTWHGGPVKANDYKGVFQNDAPDRLIARQCVTGDLENRWRPPKTKEGRPGWRAAEVAKRNSRSQPHHSVPLRSSQAARQNSQVEKKLGAPVSGHRPDAPVNVSSANMAVMLTFVNNGRPAVSSGSCTTKPDGEHGCEPAPDTGVVPTESAESIYSHRKPKNGNFFAAHK